MANAFSKEVVVAFEEMLAGFNDQLVLSSMVKKYSIPDQRSERSNDTIWRPQPYIMQSYSGLSQSGNRNDVAQLSVPASVDTIRSVNFDLDAKELRDMLQENRLFDSAKQKLASDINLSVTDVISNLGSVIVTRSNAAGSYDDIAQVDAVLNEQGVDMDMRYQALSSRTYNGMAGNLAERQTMTGFPSEAYRKSYVGEVAGIETHKMDYANQISAATATGVTINGANQYYTPVATESTTYAGQVPVDNRYQDINVTVTGGTIQVGDCFTIAGVNAVHHITKRDTGQLKTFRVVAIVSGGGGTGTIRISAPIISNGGGTDAEAQYQNVTATPANGAAITFLNTQAAPINPFWLRDSVELLPARLAMPTDAGAKVLRATTDQGVEVVLTEKFDSEDGVSYFNVRVFYGVVNLQPQMNGILLFDQT